MCSVVCVSACDERNDYDVMLGPSCFADWVPFFLYKYMYVHIIQISFNLCMNFFVLTAAPAKRLFYYCLMRCSVMLCWSLISSFSHDDHRLSTKYKHDTFHFVAFSRGISLPLQLKLATHSLQSSCRSVAYKYYTKSEFLYECLFKYIIMSCVKYTFKYVHFCTF